ncbi:hypothetical protein SDC9_188781 [bioreactor metagenome]|uniref:Uncharacterized protein n=1 Tax=bioreactor metagenome TaxID=1076179 RepID=A0A645HSQ3_9ZZZZ
MGLSVPRRKNSGAAVKHTGLHPDRPPVGKSVKGCIVSVTVPGLIIGLGPHPVHLGPVQHNATAPMPLA